MYHQGGSVALGKESQRRTKKKRRKKKEKKKEAHIVEKKEQQKKRAIAVTDSRARHAHNRRTAHAPRTHMAPSRSGNVHGAGGRTHPDTRRAPKKKEKK